MTITANSLARRRSWQRRGVLGAVVLVPLAFTGLFVAALSQSETALDRIPAAIVNEDSLILPIPTEVVRPKRNVRRRSRQCQCR